MQCEVSLKTTTKRIDLNWLCEYIIQRETWSVSQKKKKKKREREREKLEMIQSNTKCE